MALIELHVDLRRVAAALESIDVHLVELIHLHTPAERPATPRRKIMPDDVVDCTPAALVKRQEEEALRTHLGLPKAYLDGVGRLVYPEDYPEDHAEARNQTIEDR